MCRNHLDDACCMCRSSASTPGDSDSVNRNPGEEQAPQVGLWTLHCKALGSVASVPGSGARTVQVLNAVMAFIICVPGGKFSNGSELHFLIWEVHVV